jgi:hypothetical protein
VRHEHHYTLEQANALRGWVTERVQRIRHARDRIAAVGAEARAALAALDSDTGGSYPGRELALPLVELARSLGELQAVDIVLRDVDRGLIDFPALREGEEVYLCWLLDEEQIGFWHEPDAGFAGREPL